MIYFVAHHDAPRIGNVPKRAGESQRKAAMSTAV
jgi:hypothetical protein